MTRSRFLSALHVVHRVQLFPSWSSWFSWSQLDRVGCALSWPVFVAGKQLTAEVLAEACEKLGI